MKRLLPSVLLLVLGGVVWGMERNFAIEAKENPFYVYKDMGYRGNHYVGSGWFGSYKSLKFNQRAKNGDGTCIEIKYSVADSSVPFAGIAWQHPALNWASKRGGYDMRGYKKLKFSAKGERGDEFIDSFFFGGMPEKEFEGDSDGFYIERVDLTKDWKEYEIDLNQLMLGHIITGFGFSVGSEFNPKDITFYMDNIRYEK